MRRTWIVAMGLCLLASSAFGEEEKKEGPAFWESLRIKLEQIKPVKKNPDPGTAVGSGRAANETPVGAVGGVRGAKDAADDLYWKGEEQKAEVSEGERAAFVQAYEAYAGGKLAEALQAFENFMQTYPRSVLLEDAKRAVEELKTGR